MRQYILRWVATFLAFPIGGQLSVWAVGAVNNLSAAIIAGMLVGITIGVIQYTALKTHAITPHWIWASTIGMTIGSAVGYLLVGSEITVGALILKGLISGLIVGSMQVTSQQVAIKAALIWSVTTGLAWAVAWYITAHVIVDIESKYAIFGSSGALVATIFQSFFITTCFNTTSHTKEVTHV